MLTILSLILTFGFALLTTIISARQAGNNANFSCSTDLEPCNWDRDICDSKLMTFVSPFCFDVKNPLLHGKNQCGWSRMNSTFRISVCSIIQLCCLFSMLLVIFLKVHNGMHKCEWKTLAVVYLLLLCLIFTALVLDAQSLRNGFQSCNNHFQIFNEQIFSQFSINDCYLQPYIYIIFCDIGCGLCCAFTFILHWLIPMNGDGGTVAGYKGDDSYMSIKDKVKDAAGVTANVTENNVAMTTDETVKRDDNATNVGLSHGAYD